MTLVIFLPQIVPASLAPIRASLEWSVNIKHIFHILRRKQDGAGSAPSESLTYLKSILLI